MSKAELREIDAVTLKAWLDDDKAVLIDIREPDEYAREHIPGAWLDLRRRLSRPEVSGRGQFPGSDEIWHCSVLAVVAFRTMIPQPNQWRE